MIGQLYEHASDIGDPSQVAHPAHLLYVGLFEQFRENEYTGCGSGVLNELCGSGPFSCLGHEEVLLQFCDVLCSDLHV